jgi:Rhodanese-like domain
MATLFNTFPKHASVFNLFQQPQPQEFDHAAAAAMSPHDEDIVDMDESFGLPDASLDHDVEERDVSFTSTISLNSPVSPPSFQQMDSSPYGMDVCSPSPGHPHYGQRIIPRNVIADSGSKVFGQHLVPQSASTFAPRNPTPGGLLKRLTANVEDNSFSPMSIGSVRSTGTNRSGTGKVGSIKSINGMKDNDAMSKARARSRGALPSSWMNHSRVKSAESQSNDALYGQQNDYPLDESAEAVGDVSMEDAMDIDSPLAARRPPKAQLKPRPLSLFIPSTASSLDPVLAQQEETDESPALKSALSGDVDQFAAHFIDTPELEQRTAMPRFFNNDGSAVDPSSFQSPFRGGRPAESSPLASPSAQKYERCLSAGVPPSSASSSNSGFLSSKSGSSRGSSTANPLLNGRKTATLNFTTRIPSLRNKTIHRPGLSTVLQSNEATGAHEAHSASAVPSARMASLNPRRALSAFIQPEQLHSAPFSGSNRTVGSRLGSNGLAKGRVVSMLLPNTGADEDESSGTEGMFSSPSNARGAANAHCRMRSNGSSIRDAAVGYQTGSMRVRSSLQHQQVNHVGTDPSPIRPLLPFGDGEHSGKILPCHSVKEDGLMRITPSTLQALLSGAYDAQVASYRVIDCRFAYEYDGGHIKSAINLNKDEDIERFLFEEANRRGELPPASQSGTPGFRQPILVFHCEFSAKRGPTLSVFLPFCVSVFY